MTPLPARLPRRLAAPDPGWTTYADVVVVGSGVAGLTAALRIREAGLGSVMVVTKDHLSAGSTQWAQGGIAAVLDGGDSFAAHVEDTMIAGAGLNNRETVEFVVSEAPAAIERLADALHEPDEEAARRLLELLATTLQGSLLVRHGDPEVASAFCASRLDRPGGVFGTLPAGLDLAVAAGLPFNALTVHFALTRRGHVKEGDTVLVHGASGGIGIAAVQLAKAYGARVLAVVSTEAKVQVAKDAGADEVLLVDGFKDRVKELTGGRGVDIVVDPVGGDRFTDSLRSLAPEGRLLVIGFTGGEIPQVKVNRLLLNNIDVRGVGWGAYAMVRPGFMRGQWTALLPMMQAGVVDPPIGKVYPLDQVADALAEMDARRTLGKSVVTF